MKSAVETLNPTRVKLTVEVPFEELQPTPRRGVQEDRPADHGARLPQGQGAGAGHRPAGRPRRRARRGSQRRPAGPLHPGAAGEQHRRRWASPSSTWARSRTASTSTSPPSSTSSRRSRCPTTPASRPRCRAIDVSDEQIDEQLEALRVRFGTLTPVERAAADGDFVTIDLSASKDGEPIEEAQATGMSYQVGRATMLEGLDDALVGLSAGDDETFESTLVGGDLQGPDGRRRRQGHGCQGAGAARARRRVRADGVRVRHCRRASRTTSASG